MALKVLQDVNPTISEPLAMASLLEIDLTANSATGGPATSPCLCTCCCPMGIFLHLFSELWSAHCQHREPFTVLLDRVKNCFSYASAVLCWPPVREFIWLVYHNFCIATPQLERKLLRAWANAWHKAQIYEEHRKEGRDEWRCQHSLP